MKTFVITGASSGLGEKIMVEMRYRLRNQNWDIRDWSLETGVDITNLSSVMAAAKKLPPHIDGLINVAGINYIDWFPNIPLEAWDRVMNTNARGMFLTTQACLTNLEYRNNAKEHEDGGVICNIVSNASHVPMTHSAAYNASKGAAHILTLQMGRELKKTHGITVFGVSPNKLKGTGMSKEIEAKVCELRGWSPEEAAKYQLAALPAGEETDPAVCAEFIADLVLKPYMHKYLNCCILPFGA